MEEEIIETEETSVNVLDVSILDDIKKLLNLSKENTSFDTDIIIHINSVFMILNQLGIGPEEGFRISDTDTKWSSYINNIDNLDGVKTYIYLKVKLIFDPPLSTTVIEAFKKSIEEFEWRLTNTKIN